MNRNPLKLPLFSIIAIWLLTLIVPSTAQAASDKSGVQPTVLSLPSGPGSIEGLGESFQPQLNSGTAAYSIPFVVPPGRAGFAPSVGLQYNAGNGNGPAGLGWRLNLPSIQRRTDKGLPYYTDYPNLDRVDNDKDGETDEADEWDTFIDSSGEELIPLADGSFRPKNETAFTRYQRAGDGWLATQNDGTRLYFGTTPEGRIQHASRGIFRWLLESMEDTNGNRITFTHEPLGDGPQRYCRLIRYNGDMQVELVYESRPDPIVDYRPRFALTTAFRLAEVRMTAGGELVRAYRLAYAPTDDTQPLSLLASATQVGRDGASTLPPARFGYTRFMGNLARPVSMPTAPRLTLNDGAIDLLDIDADGLPDLLDTRDTVHAYYHNLGPDANGVVRWSARTGMAAVPTRLELASDAVQLADLDGDGRTELLRLWSNDAQVYRIRDPLTAPVWTSDGLIRQTQFNFQNRDTRLVDQNNDKRIDVMRISGTGVVQVWLNRPGGSTDRGNRWSSAFTDGLSNRNLGFDLPTTRLADMNGDRIQDLVWVQNDLCTWYPGQGFGEFGPPVRMSNPPFGVLDQAGLLLADVNGDGLGDVLYVGTGTVRVWLNLGLDPADLSRGRFANPFTVAAPYTSTATVFRQADINGSGSQDILWNTYPGGGPDTFAFLDFAPGEQPYLLKTITNGIGLTTTISYRSSTLDWVRDRDAGRPWPQAVPFPVPVIARVETHDGLATYVTEYQYHDGYYDGQEKEFRGFAAAEQREIGDPSAPDLITAYRYDTGAIQDALKGKPLALETRTAANAVFNREQYTWDTRTLATAAAGATAGDAAVTFAYQSSKLRTVVEQGNGDPVQTQWDYQYDEVGEPAIAWIHPSLVQIQWDYQYDDWGNLTRQVEHGLLDSGWDDERITQTTYTAGYPAGRERWILSLPVEQTTTDENGVLAARTRTYYDAATTLGSVTRGNPTRTESWVEGDRYAVTDRRDYDPYGNVTAIYDALYGSAPGHYRELTYDDRYHSFPIAEHIHTGERTLPVAAAYDPGLGAVTASTDFNGHRTTYGYDTFGRLTAITKPLDTQPTLEYAYVLAHPLDGGKLINWVETRRRESASGGTLDARTFYDGLGRTVMTRAEGEEPGQVVVSDTVQFNARQQPWKRYLPYFEQGTLDYRAPTFASPYTEHQYDALGRETRMTQPDGTYAETRYEPLGRTHRDEEQTHPGSPHYGAAMRYVYDGLLNDNGQGRLRQVYEQVYETTPDGHARQWRCRVYEQEVHEGCIPIPNSWLTQYRYDLLDHFTGYIDAQNNRKFVEYDGLGRKVFMDDPDRGHLHWQYDDAGNLIRTQDAKGQVIRYAYDGANRILAEWYGADTKTPDVEYHYDQPAGPLTKGEYWPNPKAPQATQTLSQGPGAQSQDLKGDALTDSVDLVKVAQTGAAAETVTGENTLGELAWVRDPSGEEHRSYDARGRLTWTVKRIQDGAALRDFYSGQDYDSLDRVIRRTYPDSSYVTYTYNPRGLLESIPNVITRYDYNPAGENLLLGLANGVTTQYTYDNRLRLKRIYSVRERDGLALQDLNYDYDAVSNITTITDGRTDQALDTIGGELGLAPAEARKYRSTQTFQYDDLYRLTRAANPQVWGTLEHRYDRIGNMIRQDANLLEPDPMMDLGEMNYGGTKGAWNRIGRERDDAPGPHALTRTTGPYGGTEIGYDDNGNVVAQSGVTLIWDGKDRLAGIAQGSQKLSTYRYDHKDTRVAKVGPGMGTSGSGSTLYIGDHSEIRAGGLLNYVSAPGARLAQATADPVGARPFTPVIAYLHDHQNSIPLALDKGDRIGVQSANYPFGWERRQTDTSKTSDAMPYRFTGKETDRESGFAYFGARYLSASQGRFLSVDPLTSAVPDKLLLSPQALNPFAYSLNNPEKFYDPDGECANILLGAAAGAVIGAGIEGFRQAVAGEFNGKELLAATIGGTVAGAVAGATGGASLIAGAGSAMLSSAAGGAASRAVLGEQQSLGTVGKDAVIGLATFGVVRGAGSVFSRFAAGGSAKVAAKGAGAAEREATGFRGRSGWELKNEPYRNVRNKPTTINGRDYSGHSLDQMQNRGVMPSVVENTINTGKTFLTKSGTTGYYDAVNNVRVILNSETGRVVTVIRGAP